MEKFTASIGGIEFECADLGDTIGSAIVKHEFANRDGALLEHMGQKARTVRIRAFFLNNDYERHQDLIDLMDVRDSSELIHPAYGVMVGYAEELHVRHDDRIRTAEIDISFTEDLIGSTETVIVEVQDFPSQAQASFLSGVAEQLKAFSRDIAADMAALGNAIAIRDYTAQVETCIGAVEGILTSVAQPANTLISTIDFATDLPGRTIGALARCAERYSILNDTLRSAPARFVQSFKLGIQALLAALPQESPLPGRQAAIDTILRHARISGALQLGPDLAAIYGDDEANRRDRRNSEQAQSFDALGNYLNPIPLEPILTVAEIETSLEDARSELQAAIALDRGIRSLQSMALALLSQVSTVKLEREKTTAVTIDRPMPLHLVCLRYGLPYNTAERLSAINPQVKNPCFARGEVNIYV